MGAHTLSLAIGFVCLCLTGVISEQDTKTHLIISNQIITSQNSLDLTCQDACDESGDILDCTLKASGNCLSRYYLVCLREENRGCHTIHTTCPEETDSSQDKCEEALKMKESAGQRIRRQFGNRRPIDSDVPGVNQRLSTLNRRDLGTSDDLVPLFTPKSAMVATSGNGHAFVIDGDKLAESHFGSAPMISSLNLSGKPEEGLGFPFSWVSSMTQNTRSNPGVSNGPTSSEQDMYGQQQLYRSPMIFPPLFGPDYGIFKNTPYYNEYGRSKPYTPFSSFFNSVGLQDPMLMLQYRPLGIFREQLCCRHVRSRTRGGNRCRNTPGRCLNGYICCHKTLMFKKNNPYGCY